MQAIVTVESSIVESPRVQQVRGLFDLGAEKTSRLQWTAALPIEDRPWNIGLITGPSGCGKSTLARHFWPRETLHSVALTWPYDRALLDAFPEGASIKDVTSLLSAVGFSSPPAWLRPFPIISLIRGRQLSKTYLVANRLR